MNERIKELAEQAGYSFDPVSGWPIVTYSASPEKFAELIIRECVDVCSKIDVEYDGESVLATWCGDGILKHFGVK